MSPSRWERITELMDAALERPEAERSAFLVEVCSGDEPLRREVESLLSGHRRAGDFLQAPAFQHHAALLVQDHLASTFAPDEVASGRFQVVRFIGRGGMGEVYEARDLELGTRVALKTIRPELSADPQMLRRFKQEIQLARRVTHPNVCRMYDLERHPKDANTDISFLTMEMLEGETLAQRLRRHGKMTGEAALRLIRQMADALAAAHKVGVMHCDFKPGNVMLVSERLGDVDSNQSTQSVSQAHDALGGSAARSALRAVITDFGLARAMRPTVTRETLQESVGTGGQLVGTLPYMAPEQLTGQPASPATDVYAFGLVAYEIVTGRQPFSGPTPLAGAYQRLHESPLPPRTLTPDLDPGLEALILRCLKTKPVARFANAQELVAEFEGITQGRNNFSARRTMILLSLAVLLLLTALLRWRFHLAHGEPPPTPEVTTSSPEARQRYLRACKLFAALDLPGSITLAQSATDLDPNFAMAHLLLARDFDEKGDGNLGRAQLTLAEKSVGHVTERERLLILAYGDFYQNVFQKALEEYHMVLQLYPEDLDGLEGVANTAFWVGQPDEAIKARQERLRRGQYDAKDYIGLMDLLIRKSDFHEVLNVYRDALAHLSANPEIHWPASIAFLGLDSLTAARHELDQLRAGGGTREANLAGLYSARILQYEGRMQEADDALRAGLILDQQQQSGFWVPLRLFLLVKGDLLAGQSAKAREDANELAATIPRDYAEDVQRAGLISIELGRLNDARHYVSTLDSLRSDRNSVYTQSSYLNLKGEVDLGEGHLDEAAASERQALMLFATNRPYASLGKVFAKQNDWQGAIDSYEKYLDFKGEVLRDECSADWVVAHLELARAYGKLGDTTRAKAYYDRFLELWNKADPALPLLMQARRERAALDPAQGEVAGGPKRNKS